MLIQQENSNANHTYIRFKDSRDERALYCLNPKNKAVKISLLRRVEIIDIVKTIVPKALRDMKISF